MITHDHAQEQQPDFSQVPQELASRLLRSNQEIRELVSAIAPKIDTISDVSGEHPSFTRSDDKVISSAADDLREFARKSYFDRRIRDEVFSEGSLFGEPAWDILLDLMVAESTEKHLSVSSACVGSGVPSTTALRWITILELQGLVCREPDSSVARRTFLRLTPLGFKKMKTTLLRQQGL